LSEIEQNKILLPPFALTESRRKRKGILFL